MQFLWSFSYRLVARCFSLITFFRFLPLVITVGLIIYKVALLINGVRTKDRKAIWALVKTLVSMLGLELVGLASSGLYTTR